MGASVHQSKQFEILLVESSDADIDLLRMALDDATVHCRLNVVKDGNAALWYLRGEAGTGEPTKPDLILLDLHLPGGDGRGVLREIRQDAALRDMPVILLSGRSDDCVEGRASAFATRCIRKPSDRATFHRLVAEIEDACAGITRQV